MGPVDLEAFTNVLVILIVSSLCFLSGSSSLKWITLYGDQQTVPMARLIPISSSFSYVSSSYILW
jgi:hypothetical protein